MSSGLGIFGGAFDPPHEGHVALVDAAKGALGLERVIVLVAAAPGHKRVETPAAVRLELARAAFPNDEVVLDEHPRTIDALRAHPEWEGAVFLIGADELAAFPAWKEPNEILRLVRLGVATRPEVPPASVQPVLDRLDDPERVVFFELEQPVASRDLRARLERGEQPGGLVPAAVAAIIERDGLYGRPRGYTGPA